MHATVEAMMLPSTFPDSPFTWAHMQKRGMSRRRLDAAVANREVRRVLTGVYLRADIPDGIPIRAKAAALVVSRFAVTRDRTAAWILGVDVFDYRELEILPPLETCVLRGHSPTTRTGCSGGKRDLLPRDHFTVEGLEVTTALRTALDLGCKLSRRDALAALDAFMRLHGITHAEMYAELPRYFRRRGVLQLRQLIPLADPRAESTGESWTRLEILDAGLPVPGIQVWVHDGGRPVYRLDLAYPRHRVAIEYDGREFHESPERREHDRKRREWLRKRGWTVIVVDKDSFTTAALMGWLDELRAALGLSG